MRAYDPRAIESRWSQEWERDGCYRAPDLPDAPKFFNYDSGPFPSGPLHMGHVRTYLLGDVTARYQRALGKSVLYATEWDAFGLPNELEALRQGASPADFTRRWIGTMARQLRTLGISYDWSRVRATCDPAYYRWTQWLFLRLRELGLVERRSAELPYCPSCETVLSRMQVERDLCWRCGARVETCRFPQWFISLSRCSRSLLEGLDALEGWSPQVRSLVRGLMHPREGRGGAGGDWLVSRQRSWGCPIPMVHCDRCGAVEVPQSELPVRLPEDLDWSLGSRALASHGPFVETDSPGCGRPARRETDTLDCFFDDIWCFLACLVDLDGPTSFRGRRLAAWMPIDRFHSGFDTVAYLHLHRFLGAVLHEAGELPGAEPIRGHIGHEMVLSRGRKMSKHLGNVVSPSSLIRRHGADTLRVAMLWAAGPHTAVEWRPELLDRAAALLDAARALFMGYAESGVDEASAGGRRASKAALALRCRAGSSVKAIGRFVDEYRPHAAIAAWASLLRGTESFARSRLQSARLSPADAAVLREVLEAEVITLSLFAPHLAEEVWHRMGCQGYVVRQCWPVLEPTSGEQASARRAAAAG